MTPTRHDTPAVSVCFFLLALAPLPATAAETVRIYATNAAGDNVHVIARLVTKPEPLIDRGRDPLCIDETDTNVRVFDKHRAAFDPGIPRMVASDRRGGQGGRSERR